MEFIKRAPIKSVAPKGLSVQNRRQQLSATQWVFCPYQVCNTLEWATPTGINAKTDTPGKLTIGGLTKVTNLTEKVSAAGSKQEITEAGHDQLGDNPNYTERERLARNITSDILNNFPGLAIRIESLEGIDDDDLVQGFEIALLTDQMPVRMIDGSDDPVPVLPQMMSILRNKIMEIDRDHTNPHRELLLQTGKELERAISGNMKIAIDELQMPQQMVSAGKLAGFDLRAQRNFLALGREVPNTLKLVADQVQQSGMGDDATGKLANVLDKLTNLLGGAPEAAQEKPEGFVSPEDFDDLEPLTVDNVAPVDVEIESEDVPEGVGTFHNNEDGEDVLEIDTESTTPTRCAGKTARGTQCKQDALEGSKFCHIEAHQAQG